MKKEFISFSGIGCCLASIWRLQKLKYLIVGSINTIFGYAVGVATYQSLSQQLSIWIIGAISNLLSIAFSFATYKVLVFKTKGRWLQEYFRANLVYGVLALIGIMLLWLFVSVMGLSIWIAQGIIIVSTVALSYISHNAFTFKR